jgi:hypothetical protein
MAWGLYLPVGIGRVLIKDCAQWIGEDNPDLQCAHRALQDAFGRNSTSFVQWSAFVDSFLKLASMN